jgi:gliding motility-associated lipoprotein GldH
MKGRVITGLIVLSAIFMTACGRLDVYEKTVTFSKHEWPSANQPTFTFNIIDSVSPYNIWLVIRHEDAYAYKNIWLNIGVKEPDSTYTIRKELTLAGANGWLGAGMDDIYEQRVNIAYLPRLKNGTYTFTLQQIMREDPLQHVMNAGIRVEKVK